MRCARYIVVLGPDGCGKSSVADHLAAVLSGTTRVSRLDFSFGRMPPLSRVLGRAAPPARPPGERDGGMVDPLPRTRALALGVWYGIDHILGHLTVRQARNRDVIIFARSYHDFLYQRAYRKLPRAVARFFLKLGPKPDLVATPVREARAINASKPELTVEEIGEQYALIVEALKRDECFSAIDANGGVPDVVRQIRERVGL